MVELFVCYGADLNAQNRWGNTPLHEAVLAGDQYVVCDLLRNKADCTIVNQEGLTPVRLAVDKGMTQLFSIFGEES